MMAPSAVVYQSLESKSEVEFISYPFPSMAFPWPFGLFSALVAVGRQSMGVGVISCAFEVEVSSNAIWLGWHSTMILETAITR